MRGLYKRQGSPHWWVRYADPNGRIVRESTGTSEKTLAKKILAKKRVLVVEGRHLDKKHVPRTTFYELCDQYWELWGKHRRMTGLSNMLEIWKQAIGNVAIKDLSQRRIEQFLNRRMEEDKVSAATRNRHLTMLKAMFNKGIEWELATGNPASGIGRLRENGARTRFLDGHEIEQLLTVASESFRPILITALHTGMRRGEIINMNWTDVDFKNSIITVQVSKSGKKRMLPMDDTLCETLRVLPTRFQKGYLFPSPVKEGQPCYDFKRQFGNAVKKAGIENFRFHDLRHTFASHLVMSGVDLMTVKELHRNRRQEWLEQGRNEIPAWIFCNQEGNPADMHNLKNRHFFKCLEKAGLRRIRFHELRHTFASLLIQNGESLAYIKDQLGHSSIKLTVDVYGHLVPGANREAVNRLPSLKAAGAHRAISGLQT